MIADLISVSHALQLILRDSFLFRHESVSLQQCAGRVLAEDLKALRTQPPFNASAMDGYSVRQQDIENPPATLKLIGRSTAGHPFEGRVGKGEAVRIFTGAQIPLGADTIIIQENASVEGNQVYIRQKEHEGKFVRKIGLDFHKGEILLKKGHILNPQSIALAASMNYRQVKVCQKPIVAIIATGDELVLPGNVLNPGQIIASNSFFLAAIAEQSGAQVIDMGIARDTMQNLTNLAKTAIGQKADLIITVGGASVGDHDLVLPAMQQIGFDFVFSKIAMRPGKPFLFAKKTIDDKIIRLLGLAGNPVSSVVSGYVFVRPLINALAGLPPQMVRSVPAILGKNVPANGKRQEYMRATLKTDRKGKLIVIPFDDQDSSMLANLIKADCLLVRPIDAVSGNKGDICEIILLR